MNMCWLISCGVQSLTIHQGVYGQNDFVFKAHHSNPVRRTGSLLVSEYISYVFKYNGVETFIETSYSWFTFCEIRK